MQQSLNNWLNSTSIDGRVLLISAPEQFDPVLINLIQITKSRLMQPINMLKFVVDRYFDFSLITDSINLKSLFDDSKIIVLNFKTKPSVEQQKQLLQIIPNLDDSVFLLITTDKLDSKALTSPWVKSINNIGEIIILGNNSTEVKNWAEYLFKQAGLKVEQQILELLLKMNNDNLPQLYQEINKLILLSNGENRKITLEDATTQLLDNAQYNVFTLANAYLMGNINRTRQIFDNVCQSSEDAILLIWNLGEDLRKLIRLKNAIRNKVDFASSCQELRIWGDAITAFRCAEKRIDYAMTLHYLSRLAELDLMVKGLISEDFMVKLERLTLDIAKGTSSVK